MTNVIKVRTMPTTDADGWSGRKLTEVKDGLTEKEVRATLFAEYGIAKCKVRLVRRARVAQWLVEVV